MSKVKLYSTPTCVYCRMAKDFFHKNNVAYEEFNVAEDDRAREEMIKSSGQFGVPVITVDNQVIVGFNREALAKLLIKKT